MKLRDKKTGEIWNLRCYNEGPNDVIFVSNGFQNYDINTIKQLADTFEDYEEPKAYYIGRCGTIEEFDPTKDVGLTEMLKEIGNYFETKEEAEKAVERLRAWKRLKDKGFSFGGWEDCNGEINTIYFSIPENKWETDTCDDLDICFGGEE